MNQIEPTIILKIKTIYLFFKRIKLNTFKKKFLDLSKIFVNVSYSLEDIIYNSLIWMKNTNFIL